MTVEARNAGDILELTASTTGTGATLSSRLSDGRRIAGLELALTAANANATLRFEVRDDLGLLAERLVARAEAGHAALAEQQPFRRRQVLELLATLLEN